MAAAHGSAESFRDGLRRLGPAEREQTLADLVVRRSATLLGHRDAGAIDPERGFLEIGFDSLASVELRNHLAEIVGVPLPSSVVFDNRTPAGLARFLDTLLADQADQAGPAARPVPHASSTSATPAAPLASADETVEAMFFAAMNTGKLDAGFRMLTEVARIRPSFETTAELKELSAAVTLAQGPHTPRLICVASPGATGGVHQYARIAAHFRGNRHVAALPLMGFAPGESLPATAKAAAQVIAESALLAADGEPFVLAGHSSGGSLAYIAAGLLEHTMGIRPEGVVLLDTLSLRYGGDEGVDYTRLTQFYLADIESPAVTLNSARLSGMVHWLIKLAEFDVPACTAPTLLIRCAVPLPGAEYIMSAEPVPADTVHTIQANHLSLAKEDSALTARTIEEWLLGLGG